MLFFFFPLSAANCLISRSRPNPRTRARTHTQRPRFLRGLRGQPRSPGSGSGRTPPLLRARPGHCPGTQGTPQPPTDLRQRDVPTTPAVGRAPRCGAGTAPSRGSQPRLPRAGHPKTPADPTAASSPLRGGVARVKHPLHHFLALEFLRARPHHPPPAPVADYIIFNTKSASFSLRDATVGSRAWGGSAVWGPTETRSLRAGSHRSALPFPPVGVIGKRLGPRARYAGQPARVSCPARKWDRRFV